MHTCFQDQGLFMWLLVSSLDVSLKSFAFCFIVLSLLGFQSQFVVFKSTLMEIFERLLGVGSLDCLEVLLVHQQVVLPISSGGVWSISLEVITLIAYLGNWAIIALVITSKFLLDFHQFLLEAIGVSNSRPLLLQTHLKSM